MAGHQPIVVRIMKGTIGVSLYTGLYQLMILGVAIISARLLSVENFGKASVLQSTSSLFIMFAGMGVGTVAIKLIAESGAKYISSLLILNFVLSFFFSAVVFLSSEFLAVQVYQDPSLTTPIKILSLFILLASVSQIQSSVLAGKEDYKKLALVNFSVGMLSIVVVYFLIKQFDLLGWIYSLIILETIKVFILQCLILRRFGFYQLFSNNYHFTHVANLAIPIALSGFFILPANWFITRELLIQASYHNVAVLNIANQWIAILTFIPIAIGNAMLPILSKIESGANRSNLSYSALKMNFGLSLFSSTIVALGSSFLLGLYGEHYVESYEIFFYLIPLVVVLSLTNQYNNKVIADSKPIFMVYSNVVWIIVNLPITLYFLSLGYGVNGIIWGRFVAYSAKLGVLIKLTKNKKKQ